MRVLITGASGFIGRHLAVALLQRGHELVCAVRDPARLDLGPGRWQGLKVDLAQVPDRHWWRERLDGIDAVVNAVGIIREAPGQGFDALHHRARGWRQRCVASNARRRSRRNCSRPSSKRSSAC